MDYWNTISLLRQHIDETYMPPFRIAGNLYFIGTKPASVHMIDTSDGLILIDSGYQDTLYHVLNGIYNLGFSPYDIKYILLTHGHIDHFGAARALRSLSNCKIAIGVQDLDYVTGKRDLSFATELCMDHDEISFFEPDILLHDGDLITLGNTTIECVHTPGHTEGVMSFFFEINHFGRRIRVGTHGGVGTNSMTADFLNKYNLPLSLRDEFRKGLYALKNRHVDLFIGNHQDQCNTQEKYQRILDGDPDAFIDDQAWPEFLDSCENRLNKMLYDETAKI